MRGFFLAVTALSALVEAAIRVKEDRFLKMMRTNGTKRRRRSGGRPRTTESVLSRALKKKRLGARFQRNKEVAGRNVLFWCVSHRLIVSLEGSSERAEQEWRRRLVARGVREVRFTRTEVLRHRTRVLNEIREAVGLPQEPVRPRFGGQRRRHRDRVSRCPATGLVSAEQAEKMRPRLVSP